MKVDIKIYNESIYNLQNGIRTKIYKLCSNKELLDNLWVNLTDDTKRYCLELCGLDNPFEYSCAISTNKITQEQGVIMFLNVNMKLEKEDYTLLTGNELCDKDVKRNFLGILAHELGHAEEHFNSIIKDYKNSININTTKNIDININTAMFMFQEYLAELNKWEALKSFYKDKSILKFHESKLKCKIEFSHSTKCDEIYRLAVLADKCAYDEVILGYNTSMYLAKCERDKNGYTNKLVKIVSSCINMQIK